MDIKNSEDKDWVLLYEEKDSNVDKLFDLYQTDRDKARIFYFLQMEKNISFNKTSVLLFEEKNGDFKIVRYIKRHGISITGKMYVNDKRVSSITYSKKSGFHYYGNFGRVIIRQLDLNLLMDFSNNGLGFNNDNLATNNPIMDYFIGRFGWIRNLIDIQGLNFITFNVIRRYKLYSGKSLLRHVYGCPYPQAKLIHNRISLRRWKELKKVLINIESLNIDVLKDPLFDDTCRMARMVGKKLNCSWSSKRIKSEHDKWSKLITDVLLSTQDKEDLKIKSVYIEFSNYTGFELLKTNHDLVSEGIMMNHCVGTYSSMVNYGNCAIYRVMGYTLEVREVLLRDSVDTEPRRKLKIGQFMNIGNTPVPNEAYEYVEDCIDKFNNTMSLKFQTDTKVEDVDMLDMSDIISIF